MYVLACLRGDSPSAASARSSSARFASASAPPSSYSSTVGTVKKAKVSPESDETASDSSSTAAKNGDCWWTIVGKNTAGFEFVYAPDSETKIEPEFTAESLDDDGTLIIFEEQIKENLG